MLFRSLIVSTVDLGTDPKWGGDNENTRAKGDGFGAGRSNSEIIIANEDPTNPDDFAAALCNEYSVTDGSVTFGDWYLPSKYELNLLYLVKGTVGIPNQSYWSSTEFNNVQAWIQIFGDGTQTNVSKNGSNYVRAIRSF